MDTQGFNIGDIVMLKSGGPRMTIAKIDVFALTGDELSAKCQWFVGERAEEQKEGVFPLSSLEKCDD